eukprot:gene13932-18687_t
MQRSLYMDELFAWELDALDPKDYWSRVPNYLVGYTHFFNVPCSADMNSTASPINLIKNIATKHDFVAFKLDIDYTPVELPIAMQIATDPEVAAYVDELLGVRSHFWI